MNQNNRKASAGAEIVRRMMELGGFGLSDLARELGYSVSTVHAQLQRTSWHQETVEKYTQACLAILAKSHTQLPEEIEINGERYRRVKPPQEKPAKEKEKT